MDIISYVGQIFSYVGNKSLGLIIGICRYLLRTQFELLDYRLKFLIGATPVGSAILIVYEALLIRKARLQKLNQTFSSKFH